MLSKSENISEEPVNVTQQRKYIFVVSNVVWATVLKKDIFIFTFCSILILTVNKTCHCKRM